MPQVTALTATNIGITTATLSATINDSGGYTHFRWRPGPGLFGIWSPQAYTANTSGVLTTTTDISGLSPGTSYSIEARYSSSSDRVDQWFQVTGTGVPIRATFVTNNIPTPVPPPAKVLNLELTSTSFTITATWDGATNADSYTVQWSTVSGTFDGIDQAVTKGLTYTIGGLSSGTVYYVRVIPTRTNAADGDPSDVSQISTRSGGGSIHVRMTPAQVSRDDSGDAVGYARNSYGSINPTGFVNNVFSGSIDYMVWYESEEVIYVVLSTTPRYSLGMDW